MVSAFASAIEALFADPNLSVAATYTPPGGGEAVPLRMMARQADTVIDGFGTRSRSAQALFEVERASAPHIVEGGRLEVAGEAFRIRSLQVPDPLRLTLRLDCVPED